MTLSWLVALHYQLATPYCIIPILAMLAGFQLNPVVFLTLCQQRCCVPQLSSYHSALDCAVHSALLHQKILLHLSLLHVCLPWSLSCACYFNTTYASMCALTHRILRVKTVPYLYLYSHTQYLAFSKCSINLWFMSFPSPFYFPPLKPINQKNVKMLFIIY